MLSDLDARHHKHNSAVSTRRAVPPRSSGSVAFDSPGRAGLAWNRTGHCIWLEPVGPWICHRVGAGAGIVSLQQVLPATSSLVDPSIETSGSIEDGNGDKRRPRATDECDPAVGARSPVSNHTPRTRICIGCRHPAGVGAANNELRSRGESGGLRQKPSGSGSAVGAQPRSLHCFPNRSLPFGTAARRWSRTSPAYRTEHRHGEIGYRRATTGDARSTLPPVVRSRHQWGTGGICAAHTFLSQRLAQMSW